jgi:hypothetical protein
MIKKRGTSVRPVNSIEAGGVPLFYYFIVQDPNGLGDVGSFFIFPDD